jgi:polyisoprenyl-phosphate glycosyltransferase
MKLTMEKPLISIVTGCFNEQDNVFNLYERIVESISELMSRYQFEIIFIDNKSEDETALRIKKLCLQDSRVRLIVNARNFGQVRSPAHALMQARGVAVISMASDLEDPPELIPKLVEQWELGASVVAAVYKKPMDTGWIRWARRLYYKIIQTVSEAKPINAFTGFGLYDRRVIELIRRFGGPNPYIRGLVSELGLPIHTVAFDKKPRQHGITKNNILTLFEISISGLTTMSRAPIRLATLAGALLSVLGVLIALAYLCAKLIFWNQFAMGQAPVLIGIFLFGSVQLLFAGLIGEYIASLHQRAQGYPHVVELYRVNFPVSPESAADPVIARERAPLEDGPVSQPRGNSDLTG